MCIRDRSKRMSSERVKRYRRKLKQREEEYKEFKEREKVWQWKIRQDKKEAIKSKNEKMSRGEKQRRKKIV